MMPSNITSPPQAPRPKPGVAPRRRRARRGGWRRFRRRLPLLLRGAGRIGEVIWNTAVAIYLGSIGLLLFLFVVALLFTLVASLFNR
jgi:hypothetical protein